MSTDQPISIADCSQMPNALAPTISACLIVKNEHDCLDRCLQSLQGVDEIVVVDTGSEDDSPDIARKYTDKVSVGEFSWIDDFSAARNFAIAKCTKDWILIIDADEKLEDGGVAKARAAIFANPKAEVIGFNCRSMTGTCEHFAPRLFRSDRGLKYVGAIHNHLSKLSDVNVPVTILYGYSPAHKKDPDRALRILTREVEKNPAGARNIFYLAREYVYRKKWDQAIELYQRYLRIATWGPEICDSQIALSRCFLALGRRQEGVRAALDAVFTNADCREALVLLSQLSGPKNSAYWKRYAGMAQNNDVLFVRAVKGSK